MTKKDIFLEWCKKKVYVSSVDALRYSLKYNFMDTRGALCDFVRDGKADRLNWSEKTGRGLMRAHDVEIAWFSF